MVFLKFGIERLIFTPFYQFLSLYVLSRFEVWSKWIFNFITVEYKTVIIKNIVGKIAWRHNETNICHLLANIEGKLANSFFGAVL